jgi:hypothetical protein
MTTESKTLTIDEIDFTDDKQFQYYLDHFSDGSDTSSEKSEEQQQRQMTAEDKIKDEITTLEKSVEEKRAKLRQEFSVEILRQINTEASQIDKLKETLRYETELREKYRKLFADKTTDADFSRLWETKLRDEALIADAKAKETSIRSASRHSVYRNW